MRISWRPILAGVAGGILTAVVAGYATTNVLPVLESDYTAGSLAWTAAVGGLGALLGVVAGWLLNQRRDRGLTGIAALVTVLGTVGATVPWVRRAAAYDETGLYPIGAVLLVGASLLLLAAAAGITVAALLPLSERDEGQR